MKNRKLVMLMVLVASIWGTIGYKILSQINDDEVPQVRRDFHAQKISEKKIEYTLLLSYVDPFLKKITTVSTTVPKKIVHRPVKVEPVAPPPIIIDWSIVQYYGLVNNNTRKSKMASVKINVNEYFIKEGESVEGFSVAEIGADSIKIGYGSSFKYIKKLNK